MDKILDDGHGLSKSIRYLELGVRQGDPSWSVMSSAATAVRRIGIILDKYTFPSDGACKDNPDFQFMDVFNKTFHTNDIVGWTMFDGTNLHRHPPARHPAFPGLYATSVKVKGLGWISTNPIANWILISNTRKKRSAWSPSHYHPLDADSVFIPRTPVLGRNFSLNGFTMDEKITQDSPLTRTASGASRDSTSNLNMSVQTFSVNPNSVEQFTVYPMYEYEIEYTPLDYRPYSDRELFASNAMGNDPIGYERWRYVKATVSPTVEAQSVPSGFFSWANNQNETRSQFVPLPLSKMLPFCEIKLTWCQIPTGAIPMNFILYCLGRVNSSSFYIPQLNFLIPPHHGLLAGVDFNSYPETFGPGMYHDITYTIKVNILAKFTDVLRPSATLEYHQVSSDGKYYPPGAALDNKLLFNEANFSFLFKPGA